MTVTAATAARMAGVSIAQIRTWCRQGALSATKANGRWIVSVASLRALLVTLNPAPARRPSDRPRKGANRPALTGRAARRADQRTAARAEAHAHGTRVIGHQQRALIATVNAGRLLAVDYLRALGFRGEAPADATPAQIEAEILRFASAFGRAVAKTYRNEHGRDPFGGCKTITNGRIWSVNGYTDLADLERGARAYRRTQPYLIPRQATAPAAPVRMLVNA